MEENALATQQNVNFTQRQIETLRNTVAKDATDEELKMFIYLCKTYNLDPFAKEIFFTKFKETTSIITSRDGYLKIANNNSHFRGLESDVVYLNDTFSRTRDGVHHSYSTKNRGQPIGAYALVYRDDRNIPSYFFAPISDYRKNNSVWIQYPHAMILKVAEAMALKRAFSISGLVTQEEIGTETIEIPVDNEKRQRVYDVYNRYLVFFEMDQDKAVLAMKKIVGNTPSSQFTDEQINALEENLKELQKSTESTSDVEQTKQTEETA